MPVEKTREENERELLQQAQEMLWSAFIAVRSANNTWSKDSKQRAYDEIDKLMNAFENAYGYNAESLNAYEKSLYGTPANKDACIHFGPFGNWHLCSWASSECVDENPKIKYNFEGVSLIGRSASLKTKDKFDEGFIDFTNLSAQMNAANHLIEAHLSAREVVKREDTYVPLGRLYHALGLFLSGTFPKGE